MNCNVIGTSIILLIIGSFAYLSILCVKYNKKKFKVIANENKKI